MFYKWCTSCLCIICPTLVTKAQSLNFIRSHYYYNTNSGQGGLSVGGDIGLVSRFSSSLPAEKMIVNCGCEFSCIYLSFHPDFIPTLCCVLRDLHADSPVRCFYLTSWLLLSELWDDPKKKTTKKQNKTRLWTGSIYCFFLHGVHFLCSLDFGHNFKSKAGQYA